MSTERLHINCEWSHTHITEAWLRSLLLTRFKRFSALSKIAAHIVLWAQIVDTAADVVTCLASIPDKQLQKLAFLVPKLKVSELLCCCLLLYYVC